MRVELAQPQSRRDLDRRIKEKLPALHEHLRRLNRDADPDELVGCVVGTRQFARDFAAEHPEITGAVELDCEHVDVLTTPVIYELLKTWPEATFVNCNEDVAETVVLVRDRLDNAKRKS